MPSIAIVGGVRQVRYKPSNHRVVTLLRWANRPKHWHTPTPTCAIIFLAQEARQKFLAQHGCRWIGCDKKTLVRDKALIAPLPFSTISFARHKTPQVLPPPSCTSTTTSISTTTSTSTSTSIRSLYRCFPSYLVLPFFAHRNEDNGPRPAPAPLWPEAPYRYDDQWW